MKLTTKLQPCDQLEPIEFLDEPEDIMARAMDVFSADAADLTRYHTLRLRFGNESRYISREELLELRLHEQMDLSDFPPGEKERKPKR